MFGKFQTDSGFFFDKIVNKPTLIKLCPTLLCAILILAGCAQHSITDDNTNQGLEKLGEDSTKRSDPQPKTKRKIDVLKFANQSRSKFDKAFGKPAKVTEIKDNPKHMPGEYREYKMAGHPKGLSVRFYKNRAKRFNLLLGKPEKSSKEALSRIFGIDVASMNRIKVDSLSDTWKGKLGKVRFKTAFAKRDKPGGNFVMLHAEIAQ